MSEDPVVDIRMSGDDGQRKGLLKALSVAQGKFPSPSKDRVNNLGKSSGGYKYATLASIISAIQPIMAENGLLHYALPRLEAVGVDKKDVFFVHVDVIVAHVDGGLLCAAMSTVCGGGGPQEVGKCVTYLRKYGLMSLCGIAPDEDDDGEGARPQKNGHQDARSSPAATSEAMADAQKDIAAIEACKTMSDLDAIATRLTREKSYPEDHPARGLMTRKYAEKMEELEKLVKQEDRKQETQTQ